MQMQLPEFILLVVATVAAMAAGLAMLASNYRVARILFWIAALSFGSLGVVWSATSEGYSLPTQMVVSAIIAVIAATGLTWVLWEIRGKEAQRVAVSSSPQPVPNNQLIIKGLYAWENEGPTVRIVGDQNVRIEDAQLFKNKGPTIDIIKPQQIGPVKIAGQDQTVVENPDGTVSTEIPFEINQPQSVFFVSVESNLLRDVEILQNGTPLASEKIETKDSISRRIKQASGAYTLRITTRHRGAQTRIKFGGNP